MEGRPAWPAPKPDLHWVRPPRQARSQETLDRILDAAEALVAEKGFDDTPVAEIARRADSSVGAFYARFHDKDGLLHALYERYFEQAIATADAALAPARWEGASIDELIAAVVRFLVEIYRERRGLMRAFVLRKHVDPEFQARQQRLSHYVTARLSALLLARRDQIPHPDPERAAALRLHDGLRHARAHDPVRRDALLRCSRCPTTTCPPSSRARSSPISASSARAAAKETPMTALDRFHPEQPIERIPVPQDVAYNWEYDATRARLMRLYENAKRDQWNATERLDWSIDVDPEKGLLPDVAIGIYGTPIWEQADARARSSGCATRRSPGSSASSCTASRARCSPPRRSSTAVPWYEAKQYGATQVMDEARHVEVYRRFIQEKLGSTSTR